MTSERIKEIQQETAYPNSVSVHQALLKVWNECEQEQVKNCSIPAVIDMCCPYCKSEDINWHGKNDNCNCNTCVNHRFITHVKKESDQNSFLIMEETGLAFCRAYFYKDDSETFFLDWLSVDEQVRKQGIGTGLQELREEIARQMNFTKTCLWVEKGTWMHEWYKRRGYEDWVNHKSEDNAVWMRKSL